jgi:hypothetical protein
MEVIQVRPVEVELAPAEMALAIAGQVSAIDSARDLTGHWLERLYSFGPCRPEVVAGRVVEMAGILEMDQMMGLMAPHLFPADH